MADLNQAFSTLYDNQSFYVQEKKKNWGYDLTCPHCHKSARPVTNDGGSIAFCHFQIKKKRL
jgi:hypothetical protein